MLSFALSSLYLMMAIILLYSSLILTKTHVFKLIHLFFQNDLCGRSKQNVMAKGNNNLKTSPPNEKENVY